MAIVELGEVERSGGAVRVVYLPLPDRCYVVGCMELVFIDGSMEWSVGLVGGGERVRRYVSRVGRSVCTLAHWVSSYRNTSFCEKASSSTASNDDN